MKIKKIIILAVSILTVGTVAAMTFFASADYDSSNDPLVTLSYIKETLVPQLEKKITEDILAKFTDKDGNLTLPPEAPKENETPGNEDDKSNESEKPTEPTPSTDLSSLKLTVVHLTKGQKLFANGANTDSLEIILRAGEAVTVSPFEDQGIADLTASAQLYNGEPLVLNNYCIIPRGQDGRGIEILSTEAYLMVRGVYKVE